VDGNGTNYVASAGYNPDGSLKSLLNGSTPALSQNFQYTPRLQLCRITALTSGTLPTSCTDSQHIGNIMDRGYDFHAGNGTANSGADNGNVFAITNYRDANRSQAFTYDALNRLTSGWSSANTGTYSWGENYSIDAWGNLQITPMSGKAHGGNFTLSGNAQNRPTGLAYDAAGNLMSYLSANYTYDHENRLLSTAGMTYTYDGNGERVLKSNTSTGAAVKRYWSMGGNPLAEGDGSGNITAEYIYFGSKRVARIDLPANTVHYYLSDHLGSTSIVASATGTVEEESDFYPFGTEVVVTGPGANELKFTGKRRDTESQLDYFGARYYSNLFGRFTTADLPFADQHRQNPQSWNLYAYCRNNSLASVDPNGRVVIDISFITQVLSNWWSAGVKRDGGAGNFAKNNGIGVAKGGGQVGLALAFGGANQLAPGLGTTLLTTKIGMKAGNAVMPSNQTQAAAVPVGQFLATTAITAGVGSAMGAIESGAFSATSRGMSSFGGIMSAETNAAGGTVYTSVGKIGQDVVGTAVNDSMTAGASEINILSGVHGYANGTMEAAPQFLQADQAAFGNLPGVTVYDTMTLNPAQVSNMVNGPGTTIGAFCDSGACISAMTRGH
jgi:RHS repeat-associated protein